MNRRTSRTTQAYPTSSGVARQLGRMVEDATRKYPGGTKNAELVKGHPDFVKEFYAFLDSLASSLSPFRLLWRTVKLGTGLKSPTDFANAIREAGGKISLWGWIALRSRDFTVSAQPAELSLIVVSVAKLGFPGRATLREICTGAKTFGLELCPPEVGPQLRLQYPEQPYDEWLRVAMKPIEGYVFVINCDLDHQPTLGSDRCFDSPSSLYYGHERWIFCRRRK